MTEEEKYEKELTTCPKCGESIKVTEPIESTGTGLAFIRIRCENPDCDFTTGEKWVHDKTETIEG